MLHWEKERVWRVVKYQERQGINTLDEVFDAAFLQSF